MAIKRIIGWIAVLIALDQIIKFIIYHHFFEVRFVILPSLLEFFPKFNTQYSYINQLYDLKIDVIYYILFVLTLQFLGIFYYVKEREKYSINLLNYVLIFFEAGIICAFIEYFKKEGVLDYIYLKSYFIFDLKDVYLNIFAFLLPIYAIKVYNLKRKILNHNNSI